MPVGKSLGPNANIKEVVNTLNRVMLGQISCRGTVTLSPSTTSTVVVERRVSSESVIQLMPETISAATAVTSVYVSDRIRGESFTLNHNSDPAVDRTFTYLILG